MRRPTGFSANLSLLKSGFAGALALAAFVACSDSTSPTEGLDGVIHERVTWLGPDVPDSVKAALEAQFESPSLSAPVGTLSRNIAVSAAAALSSAGCGGAGSAFTGYVSSKVAFSPEAMPRFAPDSVFDDKYMADMPIGFNFTFYGKTYDKVSIFSNGLLMFGAATSNIDGYAKGAVIPSSINPNNVIAFAWSDWSPQLVADGIRYETRGIAPNRKYIVQFNDVPEFNSGSKLGAIKSGVGRVTVQVVLTEGTNDVTIYTSKFSITNSSHKYTQGIENVDGTDAKYDSILNQNTGVWSSRVSKFFTNISLANDAVRFALIPSAKDVEAPSISAPENVIKGNDPGLASAVVAVGSPVASDNCSDVKISSVRSDAAAIDAPYPVGVTTVTWTATDAAGNAASATQTITVLDVEAPVFGLSIQSILTVNATSPSGAVVTFAAPSATDNVKVTSISCEPASGSMFPLGSSVVECTASDAAGNVASNSFSVRVIGAREQMEILMGEINGLNLKNGVAQPLLNQVKSAYRESGNECKKMSDFISMVSKKGSSINPIDAMLLTESAGDIMGALGCEAVPSAASGPTLSANRLVQFVTGLKW